MIHLTDTAITHLKQLISNSPPAPTVGLRLQVERGGCAGMQYAMRLDQPLDSDQIFSSGGVSLIVDTESLAFLDESTLDYVDSLHDSGFKVINPNATRSCGCGTSFEPKVG